MPVLYPLLAVLIWSANTIVSKAAAGVVDPAASSASSRCTAISCAMRLASQAKVCGPAQVAIGVSAGNARSMEEGDEAAVAMAEGLADAPQLTTLMYVPRLFV